MIRPTLQLESVPDCVVMVDAENLGGPSQLPRLLHLLKDRGRHIALQAYGVHEAHRAAYEQYGFIVRSKPESPNRQKNLVDMQLTIEAIELAVRFDSIRTIVLVSSDGDFLPLVQRLSELGIEVLCISGASRPSNGFLRYADATLPLEIASDAEYLSPWLETVRETLHRMADQSSDSEVSLAALGQTMAKSHGFYPHQQVGLSWKLLAKRYSAELGCRCIERNGAIWLLTSKLTGLTPTVSARR